MHYGYNRQMSDRHFVAFELHSPCSVPANRTHVDLMLDGWLLHALVAEHVHQKHLIVSPTAQALHIPPVSVPARTAAPYADASFVLLHEFRPRVRSSQAAPPLSHVPLRSVDIESAPHWTR